ncbi:MAG: nitronate monooxygenase, partial [Bacteroidota bacterium]
PADQISFQALASTSSSAPKSIFTLQMGADLAYMGTRFINTEEAVAPPAYQEMIIESSTQDIVYTAVLSGIHANFLKESLLASGFTEDLWDRKVKIDLGAELDVEAKAWKDIWSAGHGVATIHDRLPVTDLLARMRQEFREAIQGQQAHLQQYA